MFLMQINSSYGAELMISMSTNACAEQRQRADVPLRHASEFPISE